ncbi:MULTISPECIES: helix-turn-helix transcriptional regulator [Halorussus]|uniref:helix-turn-helix transcriptional regulator n=1 Tax=Halorussus TaxID=1070314 RepID=UPI00209FAC9D|nr:helix-turn-helix transcriptional regulator [Halorussus vallis]USZ74463.1 PadR family transcriptional regulator [Halorussus vallis]
MQTDERPDGRRPDRPPAMAATDDAAAVRWTALSGFQRDLLVMIKLLDGEGSPSSGTCIMDAVSDYYECSVDHARLYRNLDELVELDLVEKSFIDGRTNAYLLTDDADRVLRKVTQTLEWTCGVQLER